MHTHFTPAVFAKWSARIMGLVTASIFIGFTFLQGLDGLYENVQFVFYIFLSFVLFALAGYGIAWLQPDKGGSIMIVAGFLMMAFHFSRDDRFTAMVYGIPFIIEGVLFILSKALQEKKMSKGKW
ncbi:MAG: hypothetical protein HOP08_12375 [Cyclobacteriaceae bacterium]|nr:hypothetical protein [Cyclobacteriaceae bacterium]